MHTMLVATAMAALISTASSFLLPPPPSTLTSTSSSFSPLVPSSSLRQFPLSPNLASDCRMRISGRGSPGRWSMAVGEMKELEFAFSSGSGLDTVQRCLQAAIRDGKKVLELEVPTTDRFKDAALNQIYQANTLYARELVRMFLQPSELCMVFPDPSEARIAFEEYGSQVPFSLSSLSKPKQQEDRVNKYLVMHPVFDVREYIQMDELYMSEVAPKDAAMIIFNGDLFKMRSGGIGGYYPDFFFPKLAQVRRRFMPMVETAYYLRVFRGPPVGALYREYPGPWQILRAVNGGRFEVLWEQQQQEPPKQEFVLRVLQSAGPPPVMTKPSEEENLPEGWKSAVDQETGKVYYYNANTGESTWEPPAV